MLFSGLTVRDHERKTREWCTSKAVHVRSCLNLTKEDLLFIPLIRNAFFQLHQSLQYNMPLPTSDDSSKVQHSWHMTLSAVWKKRKECDKQLPLYGLFPILSCCNAKGHWVIFMLAARQQCRIYKRVTSSGIKAAWHDRKIMEIQANLLLQYVDTLINT